MQSGALMGMEICRITRLSWYHLPLRTAVFARAVGGLCDTAHALALFGIDRCLLCALRRLFDTIDHVLLYQAAKAVSVKMNTQNKHYIVFSATLLKDIFFTMPLN